MTIAAIQDWAIAFEGRNEARGLSLKMGKSSTRLLLSACIAAIIWLIVDHISGPTNAPRSAALNLQLQAVKIAVVNVWQETVQSWDKPPQNLYLCVSATLPPDIAAAENYSDLPADTIKSMQNAVGPGATVRSMTDCDITSTNYGLVITREGHPAWMIYYNDTDAQLLESRLRGKDSPDRWEDRDGFNTNRQLHVAPTPAFDLLVNRAGLMKYDACVQVSKGYYSDEYCFDFESSQAKVRIAHEHWFMIVQ